jgi:hypothetical protein
MARRISEIEIMLRLIRLLNWHRIVNKKMYPSSPASDFDLGYPAACIADLSGCGRGVPF